VKLRACYREVGPEWLRKRLRPHKRRAIDACLWLRAKLPHERLKPTFLIIGAGKAGTTSLFLYLVRHPKIAEPLVKEINFFNHNWDRGLGWYLAHFPRVDRVSPGTMTGDASPGYMFRPEVPDRVAGAFPDVKIIALLRNPISRAISHHYHDVNNKVRPPRELADSLAAEGMTLQPELTARLMSELGRTSPPISVSPEEKWPPFYIRGGFYAEHLSRWLHLFDRSQILILKSEDFFANPRDVYARTLTFLGLDFFDLGSMRAWNVGRYNEIDRSIIRYLSDIYAEPNRRLHKLLDMDFGWDDLGPSGAAGDAKPTLEMARHSGS